MNLLILRFDKLLNRSTHAFSHDELDDSVLTAAPCDFHSAPFGGLVQVVAMRGADWSFYTLGRSREILIEQITLNSRETAKVS